MTMSSGALMQQRKNTPFRVIVAITILLVCLYNEGKSDAETINNSIPVPQGYQRLVYPVGSFSKWIQNLPLKTDHVILDYRGRNVAPGFYNLFGVIRMPLMFQTNLEQCADYAMRLWAEYHRETGKLEKLFLFDYSGNKKYFAGSGESYNRFLRAAFAYTNSHSLKKGCRPVSPDDLMPGDLFVQNERGGIGHVSVIMDICRSEKGKRLLLIGYSFMPAQEFHIEKAKNDYGSEGWFTFEGYNQYLRDHLDFGQPVMRRFAP